MRPTAKRSNRTKSSIRLCEEKLSCVVVNAEAVFTCSECKTAQCDKCEKSVHSGIKFEFHNRRRLERPSQDQLCQGTASGTACVNRNYADVWCEDCKHRLCLDCFDKSHAQGRRKTHTKISVNEYQRRQQLALQDTVKPLSPVSDNDDSLTYVSCPQEINLEENMSFASFHSDHSHPSSGGSIPDICQDTNEVNLMAREMDAFLLDDGRYTECQSFELANDQEELQVTSEEDFIEKLGCKKDAMVKIISIFGNTGDGKSYTLNHTFFGGKEVFQTSPEQESCTVGVWAAHDPVNNTLVIDTEGLLGVTSNQNQRTRLLLKILAISDIVIYRTRAERLHVDMLNFLSDASKAYLKHFSAELRAATQRYNLSVSNIGPAVIIFHETLHTDVLQLRGGKEGITPEDLIRGKFKKSECTIDAFSSLHYVGTRTVSPPTDFKPLQKAVKDLLANNTVRTARRPAVVFQSLKCLNEKFSGDIDKPVPNTFPDQYFTCTAKCKACGSRCMRSMNHDVDEFQHQTEENKHCQYQHQYGNKIYLCKKCMHAKGQRKVVVPKTSSSGDNTWVGLGKYIWSGYVLECPNCGIIYRSRQYWYGNQDVEAIVLAEVAHIWPESNLGLDGTHNAARKVLDSLNYVADTIGSVSAKPTKYLAEWTADQIAPAYWVPNSKILACAKCGQEFTHNDQKHHCRGCGQGFCDVCSSYKRPVPERGWGMEPVRVCKDCLQGETKEGEAPVTARKVGEVVTSTLGAVASAIDYPIGMLKDSARPAYWIPDEDITQCYVCSTEFNYKVAKHHCRACGQGVCGTCSPTKLPVPSRGWDYPVRVCLKCEKKKDKL
ncbi:zinc finger FYVE domain-containing protein 1-like isoform X2 [Haliotis asinina]|uniref:zinc finger FYVE domain-containing protein 1-like isoform X2 n=1 Tax=Haliotis asinina TaxID=109174 RepID=UPI00353268A6